MPHLLEFRHTAKELAGEPKAARDWKRGEPWEQAGHIPANRLI